LKSFARALISVKRHPARFFILLGCVFLLATLMSAALSIQQAIVNADLILRSRLPAVATIQVDVDVFEHYAQMTGQWPEIDLAPSLIHEIATLPYVHSLDYSVEGQLFSSSLYRVFDEQVFLDAGFDPEWAIDTWSLSNHFDTYLEKFWLRGTQNPIPLDFAAGLVELTEGRSFTQEEIDDLSYVAIVSQGFLDANNLTLGSSFELDYNVYREPDDFTMSSDFYSRENLLHSETITLEIVGIFEKELIGDYIHHIHTHFDILSRIYVPNMLTESLSETWLEIMTRAYPEKMALRLAEREDPEAIIDPRSVLFLLEDPVDLANFNSAATALLPHAWLTIEDRTDAYEVVAGSMSMMREISDGLIVGVLCATLTILSLLILLFIIDRRKEIGIYLAMGEKKQKVFAQIAAEMIAPCVLAITLALFVGNILGGEISHIMIEQDVIAQVEDPNRTFNRGHLYGLGFQIEMTPEEMLSAYEVRLNLTTVALFYGAMITVVFLSTLASVLYITRLDPKKILM